MAATAATAFRHGLRRCLPISKSQFLSDTHSVLVRGQRCIATMIGERAQQQTNERTNEVKQRTSEMHIALLSEMEWWMAYEISYRTHTLCLCAQMDLKGQIFLRWRWSVVIYTKRWVCVIVVGRRMCNANKGDGHTTICPCPIPILAAITHWGNETEGMPQKSQLVSLRLDAEDQKTEPEPTDARLTRITLIYAKIFSTFD